MFMENVDNIFWNTITNATKFVNDIAKQLKKRKSVILDSSDEIPWYNSFRSRIETKIPKYNKEIHHENELEHDHIFEDKDKLENYILNNSNYFELNKQNGYRKSSMKLSEFMAKNDDGILIHKKYIWIDVYSRKGFENWVRFVSEYIEERRKYLDDKPNKKIIAGFIISYHGISNSTFKINTYSFRKSINWYDCYVFFSIILSDLNEKENFKMYLSDFIANIIKDNNKISGKYIEICTECLEDYNSFLKSPYEVLKSLNCDISKKIVEDSEWRSQIRVVYPKIEEFRQNFISRYFSIIQKYFGKIKRLNKKDYLEINEPIDIEVGHLRYAYDKFREDDNIDLYSDYDYEKLKKYHLARNKLSHLEALSIEDLREII